MLGHRAVLVTNVGLVLLAIALLGCSRPIQGLSAEPDTRSPNPVIIRLLITGEVAGAIEPCGCVKDQLGGLDRFATAVRSARRNHSSLLVEAGALLFAKSSIENKERDELVMRAEVLAKVMHALGLTAWVAGRADWALGEPTLMELAKHSGASLLESAYAGAPQAMTLNQCMLANVAGVRVGLFGLDSKSQQATGRPDDLAAHLQEGAAKLDSLGAQLKIALLNAPAGAVAKVAQTISSFQLMVVGGSSENSLGADSDGAEPQLVGSTLILEPPNHLRGLVAVDFSIVGGIYAFQDGSGIGRDSQRLEIAHRIAELTERVQLWKSQNQDKALLAAREADLARLQKQYIELSRPLTLPKASHFTIQTFSIGNNLAGDQEVKTTLDELGRRINRYNRDKFAERKAPPPTAGQPTFVGVGTCATCHEKATKFWRTTRHSSAYQTLVQQGSTIHARVCWLPRDRL